MHRPLCVFVAAGALTLASFGGEPSAPGKPLGETERQLLDLTQAWVNAEVSRDEATLRSVMDDRFIATFGAGKLIAKDDYIKGVMADDPEPMLGQTLTDATILVEGATAVLVGTCAIRRRVQDHEDTRSYRYTTTFIKRADRWVALALHMVRMPPAR